MKESVIIDRGRGPEIAGTRITVYDIVDYLDEGWHPTAIAAFFRISSREVEAAIRYIQEHQEDVRSEYQRILARAAGEIPRTSSPGSTLATPGSWKRCESEHDRTVEMIAMRGILADNNVEGILTALVSIWLSESWRELWIGLHCSLETFASLDLPRDATDAVVWEACQNQQVILITGNRNAESPESLEATIRNLNQPDRLPVFTLSNPKRILKDRGYAHLVAERLLDYLMRIQDYRGTGRIYVP